MRFLVALAVVLSLGPVGAELVAAQDASPMASPAVGECVAPDLPPGTPAAAEASPMASPPAPPRRLASAPYAPFKNTVPKPTTTASRWSTSTRLYSVELTPIRIPSSGPCDLAGRDYLGYVLPPCLPTPLPIWC